MYFIPSLFACIIVLAHCYLFWNVQKVFGTGGWRIPVIAVFALFLAGGYFRSRVMTLSYGPIMVKAIFLWVGLLLLLMLFTAARHALYGAAWGLRRFCGMTWFRVLATSNAFRVALALGVCAFAYSLYEVRDIRIREIALKTNRLPETVDRLRIVAIADLHLTRWTSDSLLDTVVTLVNAQNPDIVVLLGDTVDDLLTGQERLRIRLAQCRARLGKFAVNGNHERYRGLAQAEGFVRGAGFTLLKGESIECGGIAIVGGGRSVDTLPHRYRRSPATRQFGWVRAASRAPSRNAGECARAIRSPALRAHAWRSIVACAVFDAVGIGALAGSERFTKSAWPAGKGKPALSQQRHRLLGASGAFSHATRNNRYRLDALR